MTDADTIITLREALESIRDLIAYGPCWGDCEGCDEDRNQAHIIAVGALAVD